MRHLKRHAVPKSWPVTRKGTKFVVKANSNPEKGLPILVLLRDLLKVAQNRKEVKKALIDKNILINGKYAEDEKNTIVLFDIITLIPSKKNYRLDINEKGKFTLEEISEKDSWKKVSKVIGKKVLKNKKSQINLIDGRNFISDIKCSLGDSVLVNFKDKKIEKCIPLNEKARVIVFAGKHSGKKGEIESINKEQKMASIISEDKKINTLLKQLMVIE
jgi:small subunit ribosomal protein S4e